MLHNQGHVECLKELIAAGADLNKEDKDGYTALWIAAGQGHVECLKELIAAGADVSMSPLICAIWNENAKRVKGLLKSGANVNATHGKDTALMIACQLGNEGIVNLLLENGADVNAKNSDGKTALCMAVTQGHTEFKSTQPSTEGESSSDDIKVRFSAHTILVFLLLKAGAHLQQSYSDGPNVHITKMLTNTMEEDSVKDNLTAENNNLKSLTRNCIRRHLKQIHPEISLYYTISQLGLPFLLQSYLLFDILLNYKQYLNSDEKEFLLKASEGNIDGISSMIHAGVNVNITGENGMTALMIASQNGYVELVEKLIEAEVNADIQTFNGNTALICATLKNQNDCVQRLLDFGANPNIQGKDGYTALMHAAKNGSISCLQLLLDGCANIHIQNDDSAANRMIRSDNKGMTAVSYAVHQRNTECVKELIKAGADVNRALANAVMEGNVDIMNTIISAGAELNIKKKGKGTPLMVAANVGQVECLKELIVAGAKTNEQDEDGCTALIFAANKDHAECMKELIAGGADINKQNKRGDTALMIAARRNHTECLKELINAGADVSKQDHECDRTALHYASQEGHVICVKELLEAAAELNAITKKGETALTCSIRSGHTECVKELISAGANVNNRNSVGTVSPLISAVKEESLQCVQELLGAGADVNASDGVDTALMVACESGNRSMVRFLLENGADVNAETSDGRTALYLAVTQGHAEFRRVEPKKDDHEVNTRFSAHSSMVILLLKAGAHLKETSLRLNPCTAHLEPSYSHGSNFHILKTLSIAGANVGGTAILTLENNLKSLARNCIREHLKQIHPETNLYIKVPHLPLPPLLQLTV